MPRLSALSLLCLWLCVLSPRAWGVILWSDTTPRLIKHSGLGVDILAGAVKRDDHATDTLYFKFHVDPLSDKSNEDYLAGFQLFDGDIERLGVGNALKAWAYSAFFGPAEPSDSTGSGEYIDLHSAEPSVTEDRSATDYQFPLRGIGATIVFKIQFVPGEDDLVTVWLNPELGPGANEVYQTPARTTRFNANASFDEVRLRHGGGGDGWTFSEMAIATSFSDLIEGSSARPVASDLSSHFQVASFRSWQKEHGLPQTPVRALAQTRDGYVWIGSDDGVSRFDGARFVSFGMREGLKSRIVQTLLGDSRGRLWIGSAEAGLSMWQRGQPENFGLDASLPSMCITALAEDKTGAIWIGTANGPCLYSSGRFTPVPGADNITNLVVTALCQDKSGDMLVAIKSAGVLRYGAGKLQAIECPLEAGALKNPHCLLVDRAGRLWIGAGEDVILCQEGNQWQRYKVPRHLAKPFINSLADDAEGTIWAGSAGGGLLNLKDGRVTAIAASTGLAGNLVQALLVDHEGKLWVGTEAGLNRIQSQVLFALGQNEGLGFGAVQGLAEIAPGAIWAVKNSDGLYRWDGRVFSRLNAVGLRTRDSQINSLLASADGVCWAGGANGVLRYKDPVAAPDEGRRFELAGQEIVALGEDRDGHLFAGTRRGKLFVLQNGSWTVRNDFTQTNSITALLPESTNSMWIGTDGAGLYRLERGVYDHINKADGLVSDVIRTIYRDKQGVTWIGTAGGGLTRWREGRLTNFTTRDGLPDNTISQILEDDAGRLWLGTSAGIVCVSKRALDDFAAGRSSAVYSRLFGRAEGMLSEECSGGFYPAGLKTRSGQLWFSTAKGAVVVDPQAHPTNASPPTVVLEELLVDGVMNADFLQKPDAPVRIKPGKHQIEFRYTGLSFDAAESMKFRYRLETLDPDWIDAGHRRTALYSFVPPGDYKFIVAACNREGLWNVTQIGARLKVLHHFWQTWWFIALSIAGVLISVASTIRFVERARVHKRLERLEQERALERERTRIAQDLHDEMGAKLCRISFLSEHARQPELKPAEVNEQIASISTASREVLQSLDEIVWAVNPRNDTVEHAATYLAQYAEDYFRMTGIECVLDIPTTFPARPLSSQVRHHLFLAMQEALTNILKHSQATHVAISMKCGATALEIETQDNGKGFELPNSDQNGHEPGGEGLGNMSERLKDVGGLCVIQSIPGGGTRIRFVLPLNGKINLAKEQA
jgi:ligand-binding sensor domain-containing protein/signal transduction histidine kinase